MCGAFFIAQNYFLSYNAKSQRAYEPKGETMSKHSKDRGGEKHKKKSKKDKSKKTKDKKK